MDIFSPVSIYSLHTTTDSFWLQSQQPRVERFRAYANCGASAEDFGQQDPHPPQLVMMILMPGKRKTLRAVSPARKKRRSASAIEEISFDFGARQDYLTGFHKRKLLRIKRAKEEAAKKDREGKLAARKIVRFRFVSASL